MLFETKDFPLSEADPTVVIAEIGVNHNKDMDLCRRMVDEALKAGADVIKFQAFRSEREISRFAPKARYQEKAGTSGDNQLEMCKALELTLGELRGMYAYCRERGAPFLCAAFESQSLAFLVDDLKVSTIKVPSSEVTNIPFLLEIGATGKAVILSTGASTLGEVGQAVEALRGAGCGELMLFHCVSEYPAPFDEVNLRAMRTMQDVFGVPVGFSDHTLGPYAAVAAAALGAAAVEKHFTLDRNLPGPDHGASIEPDELAQLVQGVAIAKRVLGDGIKRPTSREDGNRLLIRKSPVATRPLAKGEVLRADMFEFKRPQSGMLPADLDKVLGMTLGRDLEVDEPLDWDALK